MTDAVKPDKKMPKGGRKGGTQFPHLGLKKALEYSKKLVSKTHVSPLPATNILPGVFGQAGGQGNVRASALKQYGLMEGSAEGYYASELAKNIDAAPEDDRPPLLKQCILQPKVFKQLYDTFHGDSVSPSKIEQYARTPLNVHPESAAECAKHFMESMVTAGLGTMKGDAIALNQAQADPPGEQEPDGQVEDVDTEEPAEPDETAQVVAEETTGASLPTKLKHKASSPIVNLAMNVDSSSDPDKLEKQLKLLRSYGLI